MDYVAFAFAGFLLGVLVEAWRRRGHRGRERVRGRDGAARQADAFLRGIKAFERGVALQIERDRRAARLRRRMGQHSRVA